MVFYNLTSCCVMYIVPRFHSDLLSSYLPENGRRISLRNFGMSFNIVDFSMQTCNI